MRMHACMRNAQDLEYTVKNSAKWREKISLLSRVSGSLYPGELAALVRARPSFSAKPAILAAKEGHCALSMTVHAAAQMGPSGSGKTTLLGEWESMEQCTEAHAAQHRHRF